MTYKEKRLKTILEGYVKEYGKEEILNELNNIKNEKSNILESMDEDFEVIIID